MSRVAPLNELSPELMSLQALNPTAAQIAPARGVMFSGHFAQRPVIEVSDIPPILTGIEEEMAMYTFGIRMPENGTILKVIDKYPPGYGDAAIPFNPEKMVIYRNDHTGEIDYFIIPYYASYSSTFGFKYEQNTGPISQLVAGNRFEKDTIFADTPGVKEGLYTYSKNLNICVMSHPNVGLDGYVISESILPYFKFRLYENRTINFGANVFPLNLYGTETDYKIFPEIGDYVREDGLLMALRRYNPNIASAILSRRDTMKVDYLFDQKTYVRPGKGRIVDISVIRSENVTRRLPPEMTKQLDRYESANDTFFKTITNFERDLIKESQRSGNGGALNISRKMHRLFVDAKARVKRVDGTEQNLMLVYRSEPLDNWNITFTVEYTMTPSIGNKFTCNSGGKGIVCRIEKPENMPIDADGNRAEIVTSPDSVPGRMNIGRLYQPYFAGAARDVWREILQDMGFDRHFVGPMTPEQLTGLVSTEKLEAALQKLTLFYKIVSYRQWHEFVNEMTADERILYLCGLFNSQHTLYMPIERDTRDLDDPTLAEKVLEIEKHFKLTYGPVSYVGRSGQCVTTKNAVRIAPIPIMLLDKIGDGWLAIDFGKHNNFGLLAAMNAQDKFASPWRRTPPRNFGETEARLYSTYGGSEMIAELMDRSGSIATQMEIAKNLLNADNPAQIDRIVDREKIPLGSTRTLQMVLHRLFCQGIELEYGSEEP